MKIFFDTEFTGLHQNTTLISLGCVDENGYYFYAEFNDYDKNQVDDWIRNNVIKNLEFKNNSVKTKNYNETDYNTGNSKMIGNKNFIKSYFLSWISDYDEIEFWSDCLAYDWVLLCDLISGSGLNLPENINYIPFDICTLFKIKNIDSDINREEFIKDRIKNIPIQESKHNALWDSYVIKECYEKLYDEYMKLKMI